MVLESHTRRSALGAGVVALVLAVGAAGCASGSTAPPTTAPASTVAPAGGLPGAVERAGDVKDQTNARTRELEEQVSTYGK